MYANKYITKTYDNNLLHTSITYFEFREIYIEIYQYMILLKDI